MAQDTSQEPQAEEDVQQDALVDQSTEDQTAEENQEEAEPKFDYAAEDSGTLKKKVTITVPRKEIDGKLDEMFGELGQTAQVPGFRIGRAPRRLVEKRFGKEVSHDVRNALVGEALGETLDRADFKTLGEPELDLEKIELPESGDMAFSFDVEIAPEFELPQLDGIAVEKRIFEVNDERIKTYTDTLLESRAKFDETEDPAAEGDIVTANTSVGGEDIENPVEAKDQTLRVAPGQVEGIPLVDLGKELTGKKAGDAVTLNVTVPQAHPNEAWRGKQAQVAVEISKVARRILPELNDEFARGMGFDSVDELRQFVTDRMKQRVEGDTKRAMREQICRHLLDNTEFDLPENVAARHSARTLQRRYVDLLQQGVPKEKIDENITELKAAADKQAAQDLKLQFVIGKIAERESIETNEDEVNSRIAQMAAEYNRRPERMRQELEQQGGLGQVESSLIEEKVLDGLLEKAKITEVSADQDQTAESTEEPEKKAKKKAKKKEE